MDKLTIATESFKLKYEEFRNGCDSLEDLDKWDKQSLGEMDVFYANDLASVVIRLIAVDGKITSREVDYLNRNFDFHYTLDELKEVYNSCQDDIGRAFDESFFNGTSMLRKINNKLADAYKELLALICEIIIESDGVITKEEAEEVKRLKSLCG